MDYPVLKRGRLPAAALTIEFMEKLRYMLTSQGEFTWHAILGNDCDRLGKKGNRSQEVFHEWDLLVKNLASQSFDFLQFSAEFPNKGVVSLTYKNYEPPGGVIIVAGVDNEWPEAVYAEAEQLILTVKDDFVTKLHNRYISVITHSVIPLILAFFLVIGAAGLIIPGEIRRSEYLWWIVTGTVVANLKLGQIISDRLVTYLLLRYPYLRWRG